MPYKFKCPEDQVFGSGKCVNSKGNTECVEFVRQASSAPHTSMWKPGIRIMDAPPGTIPRGTAIATFDQQGKYPTDGMGKHAAIYIRHDSAGIRVLDQWNKQGEVRERMIYANRSEYPRVNCATHYFIKE